MEQQVREKFLLDFAGIFVCEWLFGDNYLSNLLFLFVFFFLRISKPYMRLSNSKTTLLMLVLLDVYQVYK